MSESAARQSDLRSSLQSWNNFSPHRALDNDRRGCFSDQSAILASPQDPPLDPKTQALTSGTILDPKFNEEIITPYVMVNKTDMTLIIKRLVEKDRALQLQQREHPNSKQYQNYAKKNLVNIYKLQQGQIIDYMVDYSQEKVRHFGGEQLIAEQDDMLSAYNTNPAEDKSPQLGSESD